MTSLTAALATGFARAALANVAREYPRHVAHLLTAPAGNLAQRDLHPVFYGSYDWHSAVHMHWLLARLLRTHPQLPLANEIERRFDAHLSPEALHRELAYFEGAAGRTFERPYGWAWLLQLHAELLRLGTQRWLAAIAPLARHLAARFAKFVSGAPYPIRAGSHGNTAFACVLALDFARCAGDETLRTTIGEAARRWYAQTGTHPSPTSLRSTIFCLPRSLKRC